MLSAIARVVRILRQKIENYARVTCIFGAPFFCEFCALFAGGFFHFKIITCFFLFGVVSTGGQIHKLLSFLAPANNRSY